MKFVKTSWTQFDLQIIKKIMIKYIKMRVLPRGHRCSHYINLPFNFGNVYSMSYVWTLILWYGNLCDSLMMVRWLIETCMRVIRKVLYTYYMYFWGDYLTTVLNTNLHMYYDSIVDIHVVFIGQIQEDYIGVMNIFFICGPFVC